VGWSRYKFFLQFVSYTALFCSFVLGSVAPVGTFGKSADSSLRNSILRKKEDKPFRLRGLLSLFSQDSLPFS
jgi:hypothetical protein